MRTTPPDPKHDDAPRNRAERRHGKRGSTPPPRTLDPTHGRVVSAQRQFLVRKTG